MCYFIKIIIKSFNLIKVCSDKQYSRINLRLKRQYSGWLMLLLSVRHWRRSVSRETNSWVCSWRSSWTTRKRTTTSWFTGSTTSGWTLTTSTTASKWSRTSWWTLRRSPTFCPSCNTCCSSAMTPSSGTLYSQVLCHTVYYRVQIVFLVVNVNTRAILILSSVQKKWNARL